MGQREVRNASYTVTDRERIRAAEWFSDS
jgi:hypothetical protein